MAVAKSATWQDQAASLIDFERVRLEFGDRPSILVVDMQAEYVSPDSPWHVEHPLSVAERIQGLLAAARRKPVPVIYTDNGFRADLADAGLISLRLPDVRVGVCQEGTEGTEILRAISPRAGDFPGNKKRYSAFFGKEIGPLLQGWGTDTAIITGCVTGDCIRETAYDAFQHGFRPIIPEECGGDSHPALHEQELLILDTWIADVFTLDEMIAHLNSLPEESL